MEISNEECISCWSEVKKEFLENGMCEGCLYVETNKNRICDQKSKFEMNYCKHPNCNCGK